MRRQRLGFEWPVIAAVIIFTAGRWIFVAVLNYREVGIVWTIIPLALAVIVGAFLAWRNRRQIREWAAKTPPERR